MSRLLGVLIVLFFALCSYPALLLFRSTHSTLRFDPVPKAIGGATPFTLTVANPHGFRSASVWIEQGDSREKVFEITRPAKRWVWSGNEAPNTLTFTVTARKDGKARLVAEAESNDLRAVVDRISYDVDVVTRPPSIVPDGAQHSVAQGGSGIVVFTVSGYWTEAGVKAGSVQARSFPKPGGGAERFALFALPWDAPVDEPPVVYASNPAGTEAAARFRVHIQKHKFRRRDIEVSDAFLDKVLGEIDPSGTGDKVERFLKINRETRHNNNQTLAALRFKTAEKFLWNGPFLQMAKSKVESQFADVRSYIYRGRKIDEQVHLGFDLSAVKATPVIAANDGTIVFADRLGIYGNCIVVDHGFGLQSIYGHLSSFEVKAGDAVKKGQTIGRSGATGLAGGDHLHFSMQVDGTQVNPMEWWDAHWIRDRILSKLKAGARPDESDNGRTAAGDDGVRSHSVPKGPSTRRARHR